MNSSYELLCESVVFLKFLFLIKAARREACVVFFCCVYHLKKTFLWKDPSDSMQPLIFVKMLNRVYHLLLHLHGVWYQAVRIVCTHHSHFSCSSQYSSWQTAPIHRSFARSAFWSQTCISRAECKTTRLRRQFWKCCQAARAQNRSERCAKSPAPCDAKALRSIFSPVTSAFRSVW